MHICQHHVCCEREPKTVLKLSVSTLRTLSDCKQLRAFGNIKCNTNEVARFSHLSAKLKASVSACAATTACAGWRFNLDSSKLEHLKFVANLVEPGKGGCQKGCSHISKCLAISIKANNFIIRKQLSCTCNVAFA